MMYSIFFHFKLAGRYLLEDEGPGSTGEPLGVEVVQAAVDGGQVTGPHVFAGVHSESSHAHVDQLVHEVGHLAPDVILLQGQVQQTHQTAIAHLEQQTRSVSQFVSQTVFAKCISYQSVT